MHFNLLFPEVPQHTSICRGYSQNKNLNIKICKKIPRNYYYFTILHHCNKNYILKSRVMAWDKHNFGSIFAPSPMEILKIKIYKKQKIHLLRPCTGLFLGLFCNQKRVARTNQSFKTQSWLLNIFKLLATTSKLSYISLFPIWLSSY